MPDAVDAHTQTTAEPTIRLLVVLTDDGVPACISGLQESHRAAVTTVTWHQIAQSPNLLGGHDAVVTVAPASWRQTRETITAVMNQIHERNLSCVIVGGGRSSVLEAQPVSEKLVPKVQTCRRDVTAEELYGRLCALLDYRPTFDRIEHYLAGLEQWTATLNNRFEELDQELRLAWRVQQDFLPKNLPNDQGARFAAIYRPASWVSGDIYDVFRLDEHHVGFYVADVVGHGVAAALMTLFVKRSLVTKEISSHSYRLVPPGQALARLNADLCEMQLPEQQFVTACYGLLNTDTGQLALARGGHPLPILIDPAGRLSQIEVSGPLLGAFDDSQFPEERLDVQPLSKIVFISDGLEQAFGRDNASEQAVLDNLSSVASLSPDEMIEAFSSILNRQASSLHCADDITILVAELTARS